MSDYLSHSLTVDVKLATTNYYSQDLKVVTPQCLISTHQEIHIITMCSSVCKTTTLIYQPPSRCVPLNWAQYCHVSHCFLNQEAISITTGLTQWTSLWIASFRFTSLKCFPKINFNIALTLICQINQEVFSQLAPYKPNCTSLMSMRMPPIQLNPYFLICDPKIFTTKWIMQLH